MEPFQNSRHLYKWDWCAYKVWFFPKFSSRKITITCLKIFGLLLWPWASWTIRSLYKSSTVLSYMLKKNEGGQGDLQVSLQASTRLRLASPQHFDHWDHAYLSKRVQTKINHIRFIKQTSLSLRWLELGGQTVRNVRRFACKFDFEPSERKSAQIVPSARNAWPRSLK